MKRITLFILCVCFMLILIVVKSNNKDDEDQIFRNMVNSDFSLTLNQTNSSVEFANLILSRDSIYVVCFELRTEYARFLQGSAVFQNSNMTNLLQQYVEPYIYQIDGLDVMLQDSKTTHCLVASNIREDNDFSKSFSLLLFNREKNKL